MNAAAALVAGEYYKMTMGRITPPAVAGIVGAGLMPLSWTLDTPGVGNFFADANAAKAAAAGGLLGGRRAGRQGDRRPRAALTSS